MRMIMLGAAAMLLVTACGNGAPSDREPPTVASLLPSLYNGKLQVDGYIFVTFSEAMNQASLAAGASLVDASGAAVPLAITPSNTVLTLKPVTPLKASASYTLVLSNQIKDVAGNAFSGSRQTYQTELAPYTLTPVSLSVTRYSTARVYAKFTYSGTEDAGPIWLKGNCTESGYPNLSTAVTTVATPSAWKNGATQEVSLEYSGGYSTFTDGTVSCRFVGIPEKNTHRVIVQ